MTKMEDAAFKLRLTNAVAKEVREIEKTDKNFLVWNIPESTEEEAEKRKKFDEDMVKDVFKKLKMEELAMKNVIRVGFKGGRYPRKILVIMETKKDCCKVLESSELAKLTNNVRITRAKTWNQRQEARLLRS